MNTCAPSLIQTLSDRQMSEMHATLDGLVANVLKPFAGINFDEEALYKSAGCPAPKGFLYCDSPLEGAAMACMAQVAPGRLTLREKVARWASPKSGTAAKWYIERMRKVAQAENLLSGWDFAVPSLARIGLESARTCPPGEPSRRVADLGREAVAYVERHVDAPLADLFAKACARVRWQTWNEVGAIVWDAVEEQSRFISPSIPLWRGVSIYDEAHRIWLADFCAKVLGRSNPDMWALSHGFRLAPDRRRQSVKPLVDLVGNACWWWPFEKTLIVCHYPNKIHLDDQGRLHNDSGPAISWHKWEIFCLEGTRVPQWLVEECPPNPSRYFELRGRADYLVRKAFIKKAGVGALMKHMEENGRLIEERSGDGRPASLYSFNHKANSIQERRWLAWQPNEGEWLVSQVDAQCGTVESARRWLDAKIALRE